MSIVSKVFDEQQCADIFAYLDTLEVEYHKPYKRFNQIVKVPRGQASYTLDDSIHYDYKVSGGSPPNYVMTSKLRDITQRVNEALKTNFNTILLNKYKVGDDCIGWHKDRETGWAPGSGFATLAFGIARDFQVRDDETMTVTTIPHHPGWVIYLPHPMNQHCMHCVPKRKRAQGCRISLTFREIVTVRSPAPCPDTP